MGAMLSIVLVYIIYKVRSRESLYIHFPLLVHRPFQLPLGSAMHWYSPALSDKHSPSYAYCFC